MELAQWIVQQLALLNTQHVFLVPGGELDPVVGTLGAQQQIKPIVACHEEGAGFMADGYARVGNQLGVCMGIGAPGAANLVPALLTATSDRTKLLCITGGLPTTMVGKGGFQDSSVDGTNDALLIKPAARYSEACHIAEQVPRKWRDALQMLYSAFPGAAHLTIPKDLQTSQINSHEIDYNVITQQRNLVDIPALNYCIQHYLHPTKIALLIGRGACISGAQAALKLFIERYHIPFAVTFAAKGILPENHPLALGMFGYAGHHRAIETFLSNNIETLIVIGSSLNARDTLCWSKEFGQGKNIIHIDIDAALLNHNYPVNYTIQSDAQAALNYLNQQTIPTLDASIAARRAWVENLQQISLFYDEIHLTVSPTPLSPGRLIHVVNNVMPDNTICFIDSGAHRAFAGHYWITKDGGKVVSATNIGPMGWAIPAAMGGKLAAPQQPVLVITGDGCMRMHGMELATAARYQIPIIILISNNDALGNVYLREKQVNAGACAMTELPDIDWILFANALGVEGVTVRDDSEIAPAIERALTLRKPFVINAITNRDTLTPVKAYAEMVKEWLES